MTRRIRGRDRERQAGGVKHRAKRFFQAASGAGQRRREGILGWTAAKKPRGRPRKPANTELIIALIEKHDAMARRTYDKIEGIWRTHVPLEDAEILWRRICRKARAGLVVIPELAIARIPSLNDSAGRKFLEGQIAEILAEMGCGADDGSPLPALTPEERPPPVKPSRTLAQARAQSARLQTYLIGLKASIGHYRGPGR